jgi:predicted ATPase/class 3 adenylate cyclase
MEFPTGTVTFLFTDIEGSTKLLHSLGDQYGEALATHRDLLRATFEKWNGREVDTQGDSFFVAFSRASDAFSAAADAQRALEEQSWPENVALRVRMGVHTGEPTLVSSGYVGVDVHRAARISAVGYGGQILLSSSTYALMGEELPEGMSVRDLGKHRLKDLSRPEHLYQLQVRGLAHEFPPLQTLDVAVTNLPFQPTSFVGRDKEVREIGKIISEPECRLLTLVGPGGIGKSRLALQTAAELVPSYADGTYFVPLAPLSSGEQLVPTVASIMKFPFDTHSSDVDPKSQLLDYLGDRSMLMVMDNFEHVLDGAELMAEFIESAPKIKILVTSREKLNLQGEWTFAVEGMKFPTNGNGAGLDQYSALQLFLERARQVDSTFTLNDDVKPDVYRICRLVGGMPLGIELATAWIGMLSCKEIADEIESSLDFLSSSRRDLPEKHRSLRAAFDYSWKLLTDDQKASFEKLSVFRGGFDREAAKQVAGASLVVLSDLVGKSLIRKNEGGRYEIHELLRQYAEEKLNDLPENSNQVRDDHATFYLEYLSSRKESLMSERLIEVREEVRTEIDNLRESINWALIHWDSDRVRNVLEDLNTFYLVQGWHEGLDVLKNIAKLVRDERPIDLPLERDPVYLSVQALEASYRTHLGLHEKSEEILLEVLPEVRQAGLGWEEATVVSYLAVNAAIRGDYSDSIERADEAIALAKQVGDDVLTAIVLLWQGWDYYLLGEYEKAKLLFEESYQSNQRRSNPWGLSFTLSKMGLIADAMKDYQGALDYHDEARASFMSLHDQAGEAYTLSRKSISYYGLGDYEEAIRVGRRGFELFDDIGHRWGIGIALCRIGFPTLALGNVDEARILFTDALERAKEYTMESMALYAIGGLASVLAREGLYAEAYDLFAFFLGHPMTAAIYKDMVDPFVQDVLSELTAEQIAASEEQAKGQDLEGVTSMLLGKGVRAKVSA